MSIPVLIQVHDEVRRLAVAGSVVAPGDFRLKKLIAPLRQSGEKAPVFARIAQATQAVVDSNDATAAAALLDLSALVSAVLHTQGATGAAGDIRPIDSTDLGLPVRQVHARLLKPLLDALASTGSGRIEVVRDAFERNAFDDLRLVRPALRALDDPYADLADFIARNVLPRYGRAIVPRLRASLDLKARGGHLHRLRLLHRLDAEGTRDLVRAALDDGSKEMRVVAIECLDPNGGDLPPLLEQAKSKAKEVRAAALRSLAGATTATADLLATLKNAIGGADLDLFDETFGRFASPDAGAVVLTEATQDLARLLKSNDKGERGRLVSRLRKLVTLVARQGGGDAEAFILDCFARADTLAAIKSEPAGADLNRDVAGLMLHGGARLRRHLADAAPSLRGEAFPSAVLAALTTLSPAEFYKTFSPMLATVKLKKRTEANAVEFVRGLTLLSVLSDLGREMPSVDLPWRRDRLADSDDVPTPPTLDPRWLDDALVADQAELVYQLARPGDARSEAFLLERLAATSDGRLSEHVAILATMIRTRHPHAADALADTITKLANGPSSRDASWAAALIPDLPKSESARFKTLMTTLPEKVADRLAECVQELENRPD